MNKFKVAKQYVEATCQNQQLEGKLGEAVKLLDQDNQFNLYGPVHRAYEHLVLEILGEQLFDYVLVWIYELDFGRDDPRSFEQYVLDWTDGYQQQKHN